MRNILFAGVLAMLCASGAIIPRLSLDQLTKGATVVVHGKVSRHWSGWDSSHQVIWTQYQLRTLDVFRGNQASSYTISEPGGVVGNIGLNVSGAVKFEDGEEVVVFLSRSPTGLMRVYGGAQGKLDVMEGAAKQVRLERSLVPLSELRERVAR